MENHLKELSINIGCRPIGSIEHHKTEDYIYNKFKEYGLETFKQEFPCKFWKVHKNSLFINNKPINHILNTFSSSCNIETYGLLIRSIEELENSDLLGKIAILTGEITQETLFPMNFKIYNPENHLKINKLLKIKNPEAIITISNNSGIPTIITEDWDLLIPSISVSIDIGAYLITQINEKIRIEILTEFLDSKSSNIISIKNNNSIQKIIFCAHSDTKYTTKGALDNGSGVSLLLEISKYLSKNYFPINFEFITFAGEETYSLGEEFYFNNLNYDLKNIKYIINIDGIGLSTSYSTITYFNLENSLEEIINNLLNNYKEIKKIPQWFESDHSFFVFRQIPSIAFTSNKFGNNINSLIHTSFDTIELISFEQLNLIFNFIINLLKNSI